MPHAAGSLFHFYGRPRGEREDFIIKTVQPRREIYESGRLRQAPLRAD